MSSVGPNEYVVLGFETTHDALSAEEILQASGVPVVPVPAPPSIGALCGIAMRIRFTDLHEAEELLVAGGIAPSSHSPFSGA